MTNNWNAEPDFYFQARAEKLHRKFLDVIKKIGKKDLLDQLILITDKINILYPKSSNYVSNEIRGIHLFEDMMTLASKYDRIYYELTL